MKAPASVVLCVGLLASFRAAHALHSIFEEDRFYVETRVNGVRARFFTDTGGGFYAYPELRFFWQAQLIREKDGSPWMVIPPFDAGWEMPVSKMVGPAIPVPEPDDETRFMRLMVRDGLLGANWFADRVWVFDYPAKKLTELEKLPAKVSGTAIPIFFKTDAQGKRVRNHPRIQIQVAGETIDMLFDTGATAFYSPEALKVLGDGRDALRGASFVKASLFERWRKEHSDWKVIEKGDRLSGGRPIMLVPQVTIAGRAVGPIWFTSKADAMYDEQMASVTDTKCAGAVGGNILRNFRITVDYPGSRAYFESAAKAKR